MIATHLRSLRQFGGRETRAQFWPWAGISLAVSLIPFVVGMAVTMTGSIDRMRHFAREHPDQVTVSSGPGHYEMRVHGYHAELMPDLTPAMIGLGLTAALLVLLLGAAASRRLRDAGRSGWWGLTPLTFLIFGMIFMPRYFGGTRPGFGMFGLLFLNSVIYNAALVGLVVLLAQPTKRANRAG